jgi:ATP-binding cassette subfamily C (CFTR/MRP) protein 4
MALLNEIDNLNGKTELNGSVFYISQEPWIFPSTIKQNILFGKPYDSEKFQKVIKLACLEKVSNKNGKFTNGY